MNPPLLAVASALSWDIVIAVVGICLVGSGFFSGCETGLMSVSRVRLVHATRGRADPRLHKLIQLLQNLEDPLLTCLIGTNLCNVLAIAVLTLALTTRLGQQGEWLAMLIMSLVIIIFGEILPKVLFREYPERLSLAVVGVIRGAMLILAPVRWVLRAYSNLWRRLLPSSSHDAISHLDRRTVSALLLSHSRPGSQDLQFRQSLRRFLELAHLDLGPIMRPIAEVVSITSTASIADCLDLAMQSGFSRLPVKAVETDEVTGWILVRDLLLVAPDAQRDSQVPPSLIRTPLLVDGTMSPHELFEELHAQGEQLAVVVDRQGQAEGMITLEDLIETVVGSIQDEFDSPQWSGNASAVLAQGEMKPWK
jgi:CBS domain containing-hemolysin-like protein